MRPYLFVGGEWDGLTVSAADDAEVVQIPVGIVGKENYTRTTLIVGDANSVVYRHESLTSQQVLERLIGDYKAWAKNRPGGRL